MKLSKSILLGALLISLAPSLHAQTAATIQSGARPQGLTVAGPVMVGGSDAKSAAFQANTLPSVLNLVNTQLGESRSIANTSTIALDPTKLTLATASTARVYFVGEGAGYQNTLGFNTIAAGGALPTGGLDSSAKLIFPNASSSINSMSSNTTARRSNSEPLLAGDFVDLGNFSAGSTLDFFLISNGASGGSNVFTASANRNPDHLNHVVAFAMKDSPYLILGFEDLMGGGDRDYNDVVMLLDIGIQNVQRLVSAPEPGTWAVLAAFVGLAVWHRRRQSQPAPAALAA